MIARYTRKDLATTGEWNQMTTADKLREISMTLQLHKKLEKTDMLAALASLIEMAERLDKLETLCQQGRK
jgi:hypothetical protein